MTVRYVSANPQLKLSPQPVQVVTPVRRSARKSAATPLIASMLRETEFAYAPNEALLRRRHPIFDSPVATADAGADVAQPDDDTASTPTSITGISTVHASRAVLRALSVYDAFLIVVARCVCVCVWFVWSELHNAFPGWQVWQAR